MTLVVDTSVVLKCFVREEDSDAAVAIARLDLSAPGLMPVDLANAFWVKGRRGEFLVDRAASAMEAKRTVVSIVVVDLLARALAIARPAASRVRLRLPRARGGDADRRCHRRPATSARLRRHAVRRPASAVVTRDPSRGE